MKTTMMHGKSVDENNVNAQETPIKDSHGQLGSLVNWSYPRSVETSK